MQEILRTTDPVTLSHATALLRGEGIDCFELDVNMSILEGSIGILPRRLMIHKNYVEEAREILNDNGIEPL